jgi:hypothetical protein
MIVIDNDQRRCRDNVNVKPLHVFFHPAEALVNAVARMCLSSAYAGRR